ncbi:MAG TPA: secretin N-terminal domain-containing protein [Fimbriimonas sp.]|nr:secretin N-terminal domain-containing protein [Fimbriimonas sp.]
MAALVPAFVSAYAQGQMTPFDFGNGSKTSKPWEDGFKLNPKTRVKLDFHNASPDAIISFFQNVSGITIVKDPSLTGTLALTSARPVPLSDAFQILSTTLSLKGFSVSKEGNLLVIKAVAKNNTPTSPFPIPGGDGGGGPFDGGQEQSALRVYPIKFANASALAKVLNDVYQQQPGQFNFGNFGNRGGGFGGNRGNNRGGFGGFQFRGFGQQQQPNVRASSDDFSNSVIVNAPSRDQVQVKTLIDELDKPSDLPQHTKVYHLKYASATDTSNEIQTVLAANVPQGRGGATTTQNQGPAAFFRAIRGQTAGSGQVVPDTRTNSVVVTATDDDLKIVDEVVADLDKNVTVQSTTFVFPLENARAESVAALMQQAFGTRPGTTAPNQQTQNLFNGNIGRSQGQNNGVTNSPNSNTRNNLGLGGDIGDTSQLFAMMPSDGGPTPSGSYPTFAEAKAARQIGKANRLAQLAAPSAADQKAMRSSGQRELPVMLADPDAGEGELYTSIGVTQGFGGQRGGFGGLFGAGQNNSGQTTYQLGHDPSGRLINTQDLTGQVTAIPDLNTNAVVVVTSPENAEIIRRMIAQLDRVPRQVMIQTVIVEASLDASSKLGVEWSQTSSLSRLLTDPTSVGTGSTNFGVQNGINGPGTVPGFNYTITGKNFGAFMQALQSDSKFQVLATPRIFTTNNVQAQINVSQSIPYVTSVQTDSNGNPTYGYSFLPVGIILTINPRILSNGNVTLDVDQTANELQGYQALGNVQAPVVNQREAQTTVSVRDGETVILGGIINKQVTTTVRKIPLLGDIPILGNLFRSTSKDTNKTELLMFMTPHVVSSPDDARKLTDQTIRDMGPDGQKAVKGEIKKTAAPQTTGNKG